MIPYVPTPVIVILSIIDIIAKAFALWHAARNNQRYWFVPLLLINSAGILPLVYLKFFRKKR